MNTVFIVPTGVGAEIGGHAGDANAAAKLIAAVSDKLIVHPNVVNASDINEMTENMLYVEGSMLDRFLQGEIELECVHYNKILLAVNGPIENKTINAVSAARATIGADVRIIELHTPLIMKAEIKNGLATGTLEGADELIEQVRPQTFDALAIVSKITVSPKVAFEYLTNEGGINPWGGVEAILSKKVSLALNKPVAHAPFGDTLTNFDEVVDPRMAAELVSVCYMHCVLKGLHRTPIIGKGLSVDDIDCLVTPTGLYGPPHKACEKNYIPIITVEENKTSFYNKYYYERNIKVSTYLEAAGVIAAMRAGIDWRTVRRPLEPTEIIKDRI